MTFYVCFIQRYHKDKSKRNCSRIEDYEENGNIDIMIQPGNILIGSNE